MHYYKVLHIELNVFFSNAGFFHVCHYDNQAQYPPINFVPFDIDPSKCSHVIFSRAYLRGGHLVVSEFNDVERYFTIFTYYLLFECTLCFIDV